MTDSERLDALEKLARIQQHALETMNERLEILRRATEANSRLLLRMSTPAESPGGTAERN